MSCATFPLRSPATRVATRLVANAIVRSRSTNCDGATEVRGQAGCQPYRGTTTDGSCAGFVPGGNEGTTGISCSITPNSLAPTRRQASSTSATTARCRPFAIRCEPVRVVLCGRGTRGSPHTARKLRMLSTCTTGMRLMYLPLRPYSGLSRKLQCGTGDPDRLHGAQPVLPGPRARSSGDDILTRVVVPRNCRKTTSKSIADPEHGQLRKPDGSLRFAVADRVSTVSPNLRPARSSARPSEPARPASLAARAWRASCISALSEDEGRLRRYPEWLRILDVPKLPPARVACAFSCMATQAHTLRTTGLKSRRDPSNEAHHAGAAARSQALPKRRPVHVLTSIGRHRRPEDATLLLQRRGMTAEVRPCSASSHKLGRVAPCIIILGSGEQRLSNEQICSTSPQDCRQRRLYLNGYSEMLAGPVMYARRRPVPDAVELRALWHQPDARDARRAALRRARRRRPSRYGRGAE